MIIIDHYYYRLICKITFSKHALQKALYVAFKIIASVFQNYHAFLADTW